MAPCPVLDPDMDQFVGPEPFIDLYKEAPYMYLVTSMDIDPGMIPDMVPYIVGPYQVPLLYVVDTALDQSTDPYVGLCMYALAQCVDVDQTMGRSMCIRVPHLETTDGPSLPVSG